MVKWSLGAEFSVINGAGLGMLICLLYPYWAALKLKKPFIFLFAAGLVLAYFLNTRLLIVFSLLAMLTQDDKNLAKRPLWFWALFGSLLVVWWIFWVSALMDGFWWGIIA